MLRRGLVLLAAILGLTVPAAAHPHVFVTVKSTVVYTDGAVSAVRHAWRFDDMFSSFAVQGLDTDSSGHLSREELQSLAEVNVTSLKEFDFFTYAQDVVFREPVDYWLDYDGTALTLNFTLPVSSAPRADTLRLEVYDPSYFVSFSLVDTQPAALEGAPEGCRIDVQTPESGVQSDKLSEEFFSSLDPGESWGKQFANVMTVRCGADAVAYAELIAPRPPPELAPAPVPDDPLSRVTRALTIAEAAPLQKMPDEKAAAVLPAGSPAALGPFGIVQPDGNFSQPSAWAPLAWIARKQAAFYARMSEAVKATKAGGHAWLLLAAISFAYGVFHAAGPGHGKAVISSYLLATGETLRRGIAVSFAAALLQAAVAVAIVGTFAVALGATSQAMGVAAWWLEAASYGLIVLLGFALLFRRSLIPLRAKAGGHVHDETCDHSHGPDLKDLDGEFGWRRAGAAILAVGLRPCTGALIVLVFALAQGLLWAGVAATFAMALGTAITVACIATLAVVAKEVALRLAAGSSRTRSRKILRLVEIAAGFAVLLFGLILLGGLLTAGIPAA